MATALNAAKLGASAPAPPLAIRSDDHRWISPALPVLVCGIVGILMLAAL